MALSYNYWVMYDFGGGLTSQNYGPITFAAGLKLTHIQVRGGIAFDLTTVDTSSYIESPFFLGLEYGNSGFSPIDVGTASGFDRPPWLRVLGHVPGEITAVWAPSTDTAAYMAAGPVSFDWHGQMYLSSDTDIYLSVGNAGGASNKWGMYGVVRAFAAS